MNVTTSLVFTGTVSNATELEDLLSFQISSSGTYYAQVSVLDMSLVSAAAGRRALLLSSGGGVQVDASVTFSQADRSHIASRVRPGAAWTSGFCITNPDVGCTSVRLLASCNALTPCAQAPASVAASPSLLPIYIAVPVGGALLLAAAAALLWRRRSSSGEARVAAAEKEADAWSSPQREDTAAAPTRAQQLLQEGGRRGERPQPTPGTPAAQGSPVSPPTSWHSARSSVGGGGALRGTLA